jgi:hypothetical protein
LTDHSRSLQEEVAEDEYEEDYEKSGLAEQGRNSYTGY